MNKIYLRNLLIGLSFIVVLTSAIMNASGPPGGYSNAPSESNCTSCHTSSLITSGTLWNGVRLENNFTGNGYIPDSTYNLMVSFKQSGKVKWGFQVTVLDANNAPVGTLNASGSRDQKVTATVGSATRQYIEHTSTGNQSVATDSTNWPFTWKAPSTNVGKVKFYVVVMAANNNSSDDAGDIVYAKTFEVSPSTLLPTADASSSNTVFCQNTPVQLTGSGTNSPTTYNWKLVGGNPSTSTSQNPTVNYSTIGVKQAILTVKNSKGTSFPDTFTFTVAASPAASITNGTAGSVCKGDSILLTANFATGVTYQWQHNNATTRSVYVKDTGSYRVKVTNTAGCATTSAAYKLSHYAIPTISIARSGNSDSVCTPSSVTFAATGTSIDSLHWYVDGKLKDRNKLVNYPLTIFANTSVYAIAKSINGCKSVASNAINLVSFEKLTLSGISISKTTSTINLAWKKPANVSFVNYSLNKINFNSSTTDSTLELTGLTPNTKYDITLRAFQPGPCGFTDTTISVTTNACSNLSFTIDFFDRACRGTELTARVLDLFKAKYSLSFNGGAYSQDTIYKFTPTTSDTLVISIIDSLSPTCPAIIEKRGYTIDQPVDISTASTAKNASGCVSSYTMKVVPGYIFYDFYKNNTLVNTTTDSSYTFTGLQTGDQLTCTGRFNTCSKSYGPITYTVNPKPVATYTFTRNWKTYTFTATNNTNAVYNWKVGSTVLGSTSTLIKDMTAYNNANIDVKLYTETSLGCKDSSTQNIDVPNFSDIKTIGAGKVKVYPNPFGKSLKIEALSGTYNISVVDNVGKSVYNDNMNGNFIEINTSAWAVGVYYITLTNEMDENLKLVFVKE